MITFSNSNITAWAIGDPHIVTLDGLNYTFNGLGEYTFIDVASGFFKVQSRTCRAKGDGTATVFCACAARGHNSSTVQVDLNDEGKTRTL